MSGINENTVLMLHCNGSDASTTFTDDSPTTPHTVTANNQAQIDTDQSKFGGASGLFDGTSDFLSIPTDSDWDLGSGDFTIDCWARHDSRIVDPSFNFSFIFSRWKVGSRGFECSIKNESGNIKMQFGYSTNGSSVVENVGDTISVSVDTWYHYAWVRNGDTLTFFFNGNAVGTVDLTGVTIFNPNTAVWIGVHDDTQGGHDFKGWLDEIRIQKGEAFWTSNFTPPTEEYNSNQSKNIEEYISLDENILTNVSLIKTSFTEAIVLSELTNRSLAKAVEEFIDLTENIKSTQAITLAIQENLQLSETISKSLAKDIIESLDLTENVDPSPSDFDISISEGISLTEDVTVSVSQIANNASSVLRFNPLIFVTNTDPAKIVSVDISDPENPTHSVFTLTDASYAKDVAYNSTTGFLYIACADGIVVKVDSTSLSTQTLIDLSDTDDLQTIEVLSAFNITYTSTDNTTGELYLIDERESVVGDFRLDVLSTQTTFGDLQFDCIEGKSMDSNFTALSYVLTGYMQTDFKCLDQTVNPLSPVNPIDQIVPIKQTDFVVKINGVQLGAYDVDLSSIVINHVIGEESTAMFRLNRKHDQMDTDLEGNSRQITNQNAVLITIQGNTEFSGNVSNISCQYTETDEFITVTANATEKASSYNVVNLSLPSLNSRLGLYDVMVQNPVIYNPIIDEDAENPIRYNGIRVDLGEKRVQSYSRYTFFDSFGSTAEAIQNGTFVPRQNWTYFWGPTVRKFGDVELGHTVAFTFFYIGTSLSPVSEDLWVLTNAKHRRQRQYEDIVTDLGNYEVGSAPFKDVSTRNGVFIPKFHWVDESNGLYSIKDAGYDFTEYAKEVADLELQKIQNINGDILPETSCTIGLTIDGYYYHGLKLLTRLNIDNTTQSGIYKNNNGFPVSIKGITIDSSTMKTSLQCDNLKSNAELEALDGLYPDEEDNRFNEEADRILIAGKTNMKTRLSVE